MSYTYPSSLDSLALESYDQQPSQVNEEAAAADLALWTTAKFTYDTTPGQGILDDKTTAPFDLDKAMYEQLVQYLDLDLNAPAPTPEVDIKPKQPTLLPKPDSNPSFLLSMPTPTNELNDNGKRPVDDRAQADDDKRKRNTAASARFRIKKKQKEQAMAQTVRDMTDKTDKLQARVHELENEIKWLRGLLLEKNTST